MSTLKLSKAILCYSDGQTNMATVNDIVTTDDNKKVIGAGAPLNRAELTNMLGKLQGRTGARQIIPENVLSVDGGRMAWWTPASVRPIWFSFAHMANRDSVNAAISGKDFPHPALLFVADPGQLYIYALADNDRPAANTPVYVAPYYNLYGNWDSKKKKFDGRLGHMCAGNVRLPDSISIGDIPAWEMGFFNTTFTHSNIAKSLLCQHPGGYVRMVWELMSQYSRFVTKHGKDKYMQCQFPNEYLTSTGLTVAEVINRGE